MTITQTVSPMHVREVINTDLTDQEIEALIAASSALVRTKLAASSMPGDSQIEILRWTAAHFVAIKGSIANSGSEGTTGIITSEKLGEATVSYADSGSSAKSAYRSDYTNLKGTMWGQTAISFDPTGILGSLGGKPARMVSI